MQREEKLVLLKLYLSRRALGHTHAMVKGLKDSPEAIVIVEERHHENFISQMAGRKVRAVPWSGELHELQGLKRPLLFDNAAISHILGDALFVINDYKSENHILREEVRDYVQYVADLIKEREELKEKVRRLGLKKKTKSSSPKRRRRLSD